MLPLEDAPSLISLFVYLFASVHIYLSTPFLIYTCVLLLRRLPCLCDVSGANARGESGLREGERWGYGGEVEGAGEGLETVCVEGKGLGAIDGKGEWDWGYMGKDGKESTVIKE